MKKINFFKRVVWLLLPLLTLFNISAWGADETLTISGADSGHNAPWSTSYSSSTGTSSTSAGYNVGISWTRVARMSTGIQIENSTGSGFESTSTPASPSTNNIIKSIKITGKTNTSDIVLSCSTDKKSWDVLTFTSGSALDVSEYNYKYFKVTKDSKYVILTSIVVTYTAATAHTITFDAGSGTCESASLTEEAPLNGITLPEATPDSYCSADGWVFAGWAKATCAAGTVLKPKLFAAGSTYHTGKNLTLYAVYRKGDFQTIDFEGETSAYTDWTFTNMTSKQTDANVPSYGGSYIGTTGGKTTASIETKTTVSPKYITFYVSKNTTNTNTSNWKVQTKTEAGDWTDRATQDATTMGKGNWVEVAQDLSSYSDVYVRIYYDGSTAVRTIDDVELSFATYNSNPDCTYDWFVDIMHDNTMVEKQGSYSMPAALSDASKGDDYCDEKHYHFLGWVEDSDLNDDGTLKDGYTLYPAGDAGHTANNKTYYAVWGKEE